MAQFNQVKTCVTGRGGTLIILGLTNAKTPLKMATRKQNKMVKERKFELGFSKSMLGS